MTPADTPPEGEEDPKDTPDQEALLRFVERFALTLVDAGMPRMPSRVFAYVLADDATRYTAGELADGLRVSRAAISGAVRYLVQAGFLTKEREPGARSDHYCIDDEDVWQKMYESRLPLIQRWIEDLDGGIAVLGTDRPGGQRLRESRAYMQFLEEELTAMIERWPKRKQELLADDAV